MSRPPTFNRSIFFLSLSLVTVFVVTACAPAAATQTPEMAAQPTVQAVMETPVPVAVATSRGPDLEATDPNTVGLASGGLQLVEFFRFT